ncbi:hypothetical protein [Achromobacter aloeverae]|uniref:Thiamine pyrophosphate enzyme TPP-binding domain-containing protein n=1 Tax=Achromobacter aloeverae TaxID=1750518 RepID=A0A4Q1HGY8_9BURK|nr:hypothetical protein [Achromobacter aloeverae]RXN86657.1 hypothetical protein C7R54_17135 [Achromobacter aloeverae]
MDFAEVVHSVARHAPADVAICVDAGTFAAPVYLHFPFVYPQRLMAPIDGAMGYGVPAAVATALRRGNGRDRLHGRRRQLAVRAADDDENPPHRLTSKTNISIISNSPLEGCPSG